MARLSASNTLLKSGPHLSISCKLKLEMLILSKYPTQLRNVHKASNLSDSLGKQSNAEGSAFKESKFVPKDLLDKSTDRVTTNANDMNLHMKEIHRINITPTLRLAGTL
uniref:Uncharacterized protein n=1 Tax=Echinococcus canadensis TaxID=519352 RepID=A0A915EUX9_9CEST